MSPAYGMIGTSDQHRLGGFFMLVRVAVSLITCLTAVLSSLNGAANADGVGVFHDRVVKFDPAGDVQH